MLVVRREERLLWWTMNDHVDPGPKWVVVYDDKHGIRRYARDATADDLQCLPMEGAVLDESSSSSLSRLEKEQR